MSSIRSSRGNTEPAQTAAGGVTDSELIYSRIARGFHWWTVVLVLIMIPLGLAMQYRGNELNIWDQTTNTMYSTHKLLGFLLLWLVLARLAYRFAKGAPPDEPTLEWWQKAAAHATHWGIYALLIIIPILGWIGVSMFGARDIFGLFSLPAVAAQNQEGAKLVFLLHKIAAILLVLGIAAHVAASLYHHFIRKDGVLRRMLPSLRKRS